MCSHSCIESSQHSLNSFDWFQQNFDRSTGSPEHAKACAKVPATALSHPRGPSGTWSLPAISPLLAASQAAQIVENVGIHDALLEQEVQLTYQPGSTTCHPGSNSQRRRTSLVRHCTICPTKTLRLLTIKVLWPLQAPSEFCLLVESNPDIFGCMLRYLNIVELRQLGACCQLLRRITKDQAGTVPTQVRAV